MRNQRKQAYNPHEAGYTLKEIAGHLKIHYTTVGKTKKAVGAEGIFQKVVAGVRVSYCGVSPGIMQTIDVLSAIAKEAGVKVREIRAAGLAVATKAGGEILTSADRASHEIIASRFARHFPGTPVLTEEGEHSVSRAGAFLVADELDGTAPFAAGSEHWGVMVALVDGIPTQGVIHLPDLAVTITAVRGQGCRINGRKVNLRSKLHLSDILLGAELNKHLSAEDWGLLRKMTASVRAVHCTASAAVSAYELVRGVTGAYINLRGGKIWDFAAPALAIHEAGGHVCTPDGRDLGWDAMEMSFMATAGGALYEECLKAVGGSPRRD